MSFEAPDGRTFDDKRSYRKYMFENYYSFANISDQTLTKYPGEINGQEFQISDLSSCEVRILDHIDRLIAENISGCRIFIGACEESAVLRNVKDCQVTIACKQLRLTDCENCTFRSFVKSDVSLEDSHHIVFGPFNGHYEGIEAHFAAAKLGGENKWNTIMDFSKMSTDLPTPHFTKSSDAGERWVIDVKAQNSQPHMDVAEPPAAAPAAEESEFDPFGDDNMAATGVPASADNEFDPFGDAPMDEDVDPFSPDAVTEDAGVVPAEPQLVMAADEAAAEEEDPFAAAQETVVAEAEPEVNHFIEWSKKHREAMRRKDEEMAEKRAAMREKAEEELEDFYAQRTNTTASRSASNRKDEQEFLASLEAAKANAGNPFERVCSLVDMKADADGADLSRMRNVLLQLKATAFKPSA